MEAIKEVIVVEGRDDTRAIKRAMEAHTIETHGFGISQNTMEMIEKAYMERGIIIFTDPDHAGENIRRRLAKAFPKAKHAYLTQDQARKNQDIGIENASKESILKALQEARATVEEKSFQFSLEDLREEGLVGRKDSRQLREKLGRVLGLGYSNGKGLVSKLNGFGISREDFLHALEKIRNENKE